MLTRKMIEDYIRPVATKYPVKKVILFGSYARGESSENSDIDLIIDSGGVLTGMNFFSLVYDINEVFPVRADVFEMREIKVPSLFYDNIVKEGVVIYAEQ